MAVTGINIALTLRSVKGTALTHAELDANQSGLKDSVEQHSHDDFALSDHNHDMAYAWADKGVTNGDAHDHSGGDGGQIAYSSLSGIPAVFAPDAHTVVSHADWPAGLTTTELSYLGGVTSDIQGQIDGKEAVGAAAGAVLAHAGANTHEQIDTALTRLASTSGTNTGDQDLSGYSLVSGKLSQFAATTSAELAGVISDETGSGSLVFATSPTLVTPNIGVATGTSFNSITGLATASPLVDGTAAVGTSTKAAKEDHVHPTDTTRAPVASPTFTGTVTLPSTTSIGNVSSTELGYLDGVTSGIQSQLNAKANDAEMVKLTGDQTVAGIKTLTSKTNLSGGALLPNVEALDFTANNRPSIRPSLLLDFANSKTLDPRVTFARASTGTYFDQFGMLRTAAVDQPRIDHDPVTGECKGLLIEEARTNSSTYSELLITGLGYGWTQDLTVSTLNAGIAPDGTNTATRVVEIAGTTGLHSVRKTVAATVAQSWTASIFAKAGSGIFPRNQMQIYMYDANATANFVTATFDLATGTVSAESNGGGASGAVGYIIPVGNGWYRCCLSGQPSTSGTSVRFDYVLRNETTINYDPGVGNEGDIYFWGAQLEAGQHPTSYIPTTNSTVTRAADSAGLLSSSFSSWYNQLEGTFVIELEWPTVSSTSTAAGFSVSDGTANNRIILSRAGTGTTPQIVVSVAGVNQTGVFAGGVTADTLFKLAFSYKENSFLFALNGSQTSNSIDLSGSLPIVDRFYFGDQTGATVSKYIKRFTYYPKQFTSGQLKGLTTI